MTKKNDVYEMFIDHAETWKCIDCMEVWKDHLDGSCLFESGNQYNPDFINGINYPKKQLTPDTKKRFIQYLKNNMKGGWFVEYTLLDFISET